jgi:hypothetical protein
MARSFSSPGNAEPLRSGDRGHTVTLGTPQKLIVIDDQDVALRIDSGPTSVSHAVTRSSVSEFKSLDGRQRPAYARKIATPISRRVHQRLRPRADGHKRACASNDVANAFDVPGGAETQCVLGDSVFGISGRQAGPAGGAIGMVCQREDHQARSITRFPDRLHALRKLNQVTLSASRESWSGLSLAANSNSDPVIITPLATRLISNNCRIGTQGWFPWFQMNRLRYWDTLLSRLFPIGSRILVRYDPMNLSRVYVPSPTGDGYLGIPYADLRRPPISLGELERVHAALAERGESQPSEDTIFATVREQRRLEEKAAARTRKARRSLELRPPMPPPPPNPESKVNYKKRVVPYTGELW